MRQLHLHPHVAVRSGLQKGRRRGRLGRHAGKGLDGGVADVVPAQHTLDGARDGAAAETVLGRIPVAGADGAAASGPVPLLLRPEQIRIAGEGVPATVVRVEFFGPDATVGLRLAGGTSIEIRHPSTELPAPGEDVRLQVVGEAVILGSPAAQR